MSVSCPFSLELTGPGVNVFPNPQYSHCFPQKFHNQPKLKTLMFSLQTPRSLLSSPLLLSPHFLSQNLLLSSTILIRGEWWQPDLVERDDSVVDRIVIEDCWNMGRLCRRNSYITRRMRHKRSNVVEGDHYFKKKNKGFSVIFSPKYCKLVEIVPGWVIRMISEYRKNT